MMWWQTLPATIDPVLFSIGSFDVRWYSLAYFVAFLSAWGVLWMQNRRGWCAFWFSDTNLFDVLVLIFLGGVIGARLGHAFFYNPEETLTSPFLVFWPFNDLGVFVGLSGMSFHGGIIGASLVGWWWAKKNSRNVLQVADCLVLALPLALFFGRVGNFLNHELFGKETTFFLAMNVDGVLRHPTQLYEAFFCGVGIFLLLLCVRFCLQSNQTNYLNESVFLPYGKFFALFCVSYGVMRFILEYTREDVGFPVARVLSVLLVCVGVSVWFFGRRFSQRGIKNRTQARGSKSV